MPALAAVILLQLFSYGRVSGVPEFVPWGLAVAVILIVVEYARRSSSPR